MMLRRVLAPWPPISQRPSATPATDRDPSAISPRNPEIRARCNKAAHMVFRVAKNATRNTSCVGDFPCGRGREKVDELLVQGIGGIPGPQSTWRDSADEPFGSQNRAGAAGREQRIGDRGEEERR